MRDLLAGVERFQRDIYPRKRDLFSELDGGQSPRTLFITCSDSRIVPNLITNTDPGEIFVLRNAGNLVPPHDQGRGEAATIEYAVQVLKVEDIVVCGHARCGAMAALLDPHSCDSLPAVGEWIAPARKMIDELRERHGDVAEAELLNLAIGENVVRQLESLKTHPSVRQALETNAVELHGWVYSIATGGIEVYDPQQQSFIAPDTGTRTV